MVQENYNKYSKSNCLGGDDDARIGMLAMHKNTFAERQQLFNEFLTIWGHADRAKYELARGKISEIGFPLDQYHFSFDQYRLAKKRYPDVFAGWLDNDVEGLAAKLEEHFGKVIFTFVDTN